MIRPSVDLILRLNKELRGPDEFFLDDEEELHRVERVLRETEAISDCASLAGALISRLARAQAFADGNKRTALALAHFVLTFNGFDPEVYLPPQDGRIWEYLVRAARGEGVEPEILVFFGVLG